MNTMELVSTNMSTGLSTTTSLKVAQVFGKDHDKVCRDIKTLGCSEEFRAANFGESSFTSLQGKNLPMYEITRDGFSFLVMGYTGHKAAEFKEDFIKAFNQREALLKSDDFIVNRALAILSERAKALEESVQRQTLQIEAQVEQLKIQAPKVEYHDAVLQSAGLIATTVIAQEIGRSAISLNRELVRRKIIYGVNGTYALSAPYRGEGYTAYRTHFHTDSLGRTVSTQHLYWTQLGRKFLLEIFKSQKTA